MEYRIGLVTAYCSLLLLFLLLYYNIPIFYTIPSQIELSSVKFNSNSHGTLHPSFDNIYWFMYLYHYQTGTVHSIWSSEIVIFICICIRICICVNFSSTQGFCCVLCPIWNIYGTDSLHPQKWETTFMSLALCCGGSCNSFSFLSFHYFFLFVFL